MISEKQKERWKFVCVMAILFCFLYTYITPVAVMKPRIRKGSGINSLLSLCTMSFSHLNNLKWCTSFSSGTDVLPQAASCIPRSICTAEINSYVLSSEGAIHRIKKMFDKVDLSVSSYDTAWVAMVPSPGSGKEPFFPECVNWLLDNQLQNGSWGLPDMHPSLTKDALLSTLACILALKRWNIGEKEIDNGLHFIASNIASASDGEQPSPVGFDIMFPSMIESALKLDVNLHVGGSTLDGLLLKRDVELQRGNGSSSEGWRAYQAYISEGMAKSQVDWEMVIKYQKKNGSLFNSPATTAAAFTHLNNARCLSYLRSLIDKFGSAVPTIYPLDKYARLSMVSSLEIMGVARHFKEEITSVLDETYRCWLQGDEDILSDGSTCAMAFRLLRLHGYHVSADPLSQFSEDRFFNSLGGYLKDTDAAALELFRASEVIIYPDESVLQKQHHWTSEFLKQEISNNLFRAHGLDKHIDQVDDAIHFPSYATLDRLANRNAIKFYNTDGTKMLKTSYRCLNVGNEDFLELAVEDFNMCQSVYREELERINRWVVESRLDNLKFARQKQAYCYFSAAGTLFAPELSDARMFMTKNSVLATVVDDLFDFGGSEEELVNLVDLIEKWDVNARTDSCSEQVEIIFSAIKSTIDEIGAKAYSRQDRSVTNHVREIWSDAVKAMLKEASCKINKSAPTLDEYMENAYVSFILGPVVLPTLYFVGPKLSEEAVHSSEYHRMFKLMSTAARLLNDIQSFKREFAEGKLNSVTLTMLHADGGVSEEEIITEMKSIITNQRRELQRLVLQDGLVPKACKDVFWSICKVVHLFYADHDGYSSEDLMKTISGITEEPILLCDLN